MDLEKMCFFKANSSLENRFVFESIVKKYEYVYTSVIRLWRGKRCSFLQRESLDVHTSEEQRKYSDNTIPHTASAINDTKKITGTFFRLLCFSRVLCVRFHVNAYQENFFPSKF